MIKQVLFSFALLNVILLAGCGMTQNVSETDSNSLKQETLTGDYQSSRGVMTPLSCYCSDGGTLAVSEDEKIKVCFDKLDKKPENCQKITVTGHYETLANDPEETSPCPKGTMKVFVVESFKCK